MLGINYNVLCDLLKYFDSKIPLTVWTEFKSQTGFYMPSSSIIENLKNAWICISKNFECDLKNWSIVGEKQNALLRIEIRFSV